MTHMSNLKEYVIIKKNIKQQQQQLFEDNRLLNSESQWLSWIYKSLEFLFIVWEVGYELQRDTNVIP